jgi:putative nucleotidyltransferase with HDIG domain
LDQVIQIIFEELRADTGSIWLFDEETNLLKLAIARGLPDQILKKTIALGKGIAGKVAQTRKPVLIQGKVSESLITAEERPHSSISVPILFHREIRGVICINLVHSKERFAYRDLQLLQIMANHVATALDNILLISALKTNNYALIRSLAEAVEAKDPYIAGHCEYVSRYAVALARELGASPRELEEIKIGSILHDVGKIGLQEEIILKEGPLTKEEFERVKKHPLKGAQIVEPLKLPKISMDIILYHHERPDGMGYPYGLSDIDIPKQAKIVAIADTFDALTSHRIYRLGKTTEEALKEMQRCAGRQLDRKMTQAFIRLFPRLGSEKILRPHLLTAQEIQEKKFSQI